MAPNDLDHYKIKIAKMSWYFVKIISLFDKNMTPRLTKSVNKHTFAEQIYRSGQILLVRDLISNRLIRALNS